MNTTGSASKKRQSFYRNSFENFSVVCLHILEKFNHCIALKNKTEEKDIPIKWKNHK